MAEVTNNLYPQTTIEDNATAQKIVEILQTYGFRISAQQGGYIARTPSVRSGYTFEKLTPNTVDMETLFAKLSEGI